VDLGAAGVALQATAKGQPDRQAARVPVDGLGSQAQLVLEGRTVEERLELLGSGDLAEAGGQATSSP
jgi:hypothetical protein